MNRSSGRGPSANERLRQTWDTHLARGAPLAVLLHAALFFLTPSWGTPPLGDEPIDFGGGLVLLAPLGDIPIDATGTAPVAASVFGEADGTGSETGNGSAVIEGPLVTADDPGSLWDAVGDRLRRGRAIAPSLAIPSTVRDADAPGAKPGDEPEAVEADEDDPVIEADVLTVELADLPASDSIDLGRLTGLRPELAFMTASAWVLIRNQEEVEAYLRRTYRDGTLDPSISGTVSVTLWIDRQGTVEWAEVSQSSGRTDIDEVALALFNEVADFRAARDRGETVSRSVTFSLNFPW